MIRHIVFLVVEGEGAAADDETFEIEVQANDHDEACAAAKQVLAVQRPDVNVDKVWVKSSHVIGLQAP